MGTGYAITHGAHLEDEQSTALACSTRVGHRPIFDASFTTSEGHIMYKFRRNTFFKPATLVMASAMCTALGLSSAAPALAQGACSDPSINSLTAFALGTNNTISVLRPGSLGQASQVSGIAGNLIGIDFRPSDPNNGSFYGLTDTGNVYLLDPSVTPYRATLVSTIAPRFAGGYQSLADFNPTGAQNALRIIGSNDQNVALVGATLKSECGWSKAIDVCHG
jgi:hypothetical protein